MGTVAILEFLWLYYTAGKRTRRQAAKPRGTDPRTRVSFRVRQSRDLSQLPPKKSLLAGYGFTSL